MQIPGLKTFKPLSILASSRSSCLDTIFEGINGCSDSIIKRRINNNIRLWYRSSDDQHAHLGVEKLDSDTIEKYRTYGI